MSKIDIDKNLKKFLKKNKAWKKFKKNVKVYAVGYDITEIHHSFQWYVTPEGRKYWIKLNAKYMEEQNG